MTDDGRAGHHFAWAGWNFAEELVKETGAKLALPSCHIYVFYCLLKCVCFKKYQTSACLNMSAKINAIPIACLDASAKKNGMERN